MTSSEVLGLSHSVVVSTADFESAVLGSNPSGRRKETSQGAPAATVRAPAFLVRRERRGEERSSKGAARKGTVTRV